MNARLDNLQSPQPVGPSQLGCSFHPFFDAHVQDC